MHFIFRQGQRFFTRTCGIIFQIRMIFFSFQPNVQPLFIEKGEHSSGETCLVPDESPVSDQFWSDAADNTLKTFLSIRLDPLGIGCFDNALFYQSADHAEEIIDNVRLVTNYDGKIIENDVSRFWMLSDDL